MVFIAAIGAFALSAVLSLHGQLPNIGGYSLPLLLAAACILYFFMAAGLLQGPLFPTLTPLDAGTANTSTVRALMIVWCFLAGFSERLVPALLAKTEERALSHTPSGSDHFKPSPTGAPDAASTASNSAAPKEPAKPAAPATTGPTSQTATGT